MRVGLGFDAHAFDDSRPLIIGGVHIEGSPGLSGHSDSDVLSHAIADALLGAARLGDLGERFPNNERWRDASSLEIITTTARHVKDAGWMLENLDATVIAERPQLSPYRLAMIETLTRALDCAPQQISVKFTSTDGLGTVGRGEGIGAMAVVLLTRIEH